MWDGAPYVPEGLRISGNPSEIAAAKAAGFQDVIVDLPPTGEGWKETIGELESAGMNYIISIDALFPSARGFAVEPEAYRVSGITMDQHVEFPMPSASSAFVALVTERDASIQKTERVQITNGKFVYDVKVPNGLENVLLVYPEQSDAAHADYWDSFDSQRDILLATLIRNKCGRGLRGFLNPMGKFFATVSRAGLFVPSSPFFRMEYRTYLEQKYRTVDTAMRAWGIGTNDIDSFEGLARLVPLWSQTRGVGALWDPSSNRIYECEQKRSLIWGDIESVIASAAAKRFSRLIASLQRVDDVPVIQDWTGWVPPFETASPEISGIGYATSGISVDSIVDGASRPTSSLMRWKTPGWLVCTDLRVDKSLDRNVLDNALSQLGSMGTRGMFYRTTNKIVRTGAVDAWATESSPQVLYFPENAYNPATPKLLGSGKWWLPSPADGNRIDFGDGFHGYRYADANGINTVLWSDQPQRVRLRMSAPKLATFTPSDGVDPKARASKDGVELTLGENPLLISGTDEMPVPEPCIVDTTVKFQQLLNFGTGSGRDLSTESFMYRDSIAAFDRNPGDSFTNLRKQFWQLDRKLGQFTWIEAESSKNTNFSEVLAESGCSNNASLRLHIPTAARQAYFAEYNVTTRYEGDQEVWLAARIPNDARKSVSVDVAGQKLAFSDPPVSGYSSGYAWYRLGTTRIPKGVQKITVSVDPSDGVDLAIDTILLCPGHFIPRGISMPDAIVFVATPEKGKRK